MLFRSYGIIDVSRNRIVCNIPKDLKGFVGFYIKIRSVMLDKIKDDVMLYDPGDSSLHLTICTSKNEII